MNEKLVKVTELNEIIQNSKRILEPAVVAKGIMSYESQNMKFRNGLKEMGLSCPKFKRGLIDKNQLQYAFGKIGLQRISASGKAPHLYKTNEKSCYVENHSNPF